MNDSMQDLYDDFLIGFMRAVDEKSRPEDPDQQSGFDAAQEMARQTGRYVWSLDAFAADAADEFVAPRRPEEN